MPALASGRYTVCCSLLVSLANIHFVFGKPATAHFDIGTDLANPRDKILKTAQKQLERGNFSRAVREYTKVLKSQPGDTRTRLRMGDVYARMGKRPKAIETYETVAQEYAREGFFLKAVAILKQILRLDPGRTDVQIQLAELYLQLNLLSDSVAQYRAVAERYRTEGEVQRYLGILERMSEIDPHDIRIQITLGERYSELGEVSQAADYFGRAADALLERDRLDEYIKVAERYVFHCQGDMPRLKQLARIYLERSDFKRALAKLQLVFRTDNQDIGALELLVQALIGLEKFEKAVRALKELAGLYDADSRVELVQDCYRRVFEIAPDDVEARTQLGFSIPSDIGLDSSDDDRRFLSTIPPVDTEGETPLRPTEIEEDEYYAWRRLKTGAGLITTASGVTSCNSEVSEDYLEEVERLLVEMEGYEKYGLYERARDTLKRIFEFDPLNITAMEHAVRLDSARGNSENAIQRLLRMTRLCWKPDPVRATHYLNEALTFAPDHPASVALRNELGLDGIDLETFMLETSEEALQLVPEGTGDIAEHVVSPAPHPTPAQFSQEQSDQFGVDRLVWHQPETEVDLESTEQNAVSSVSQVAPGFPPPPVPDYSDPAVAKHSATPIVDTRGWPDTDDDPDNLEDTEVPTKGPEYDVLTSIAQTVPEAGATPQQTTQQKPQKNASWDVPTGVTNKVPAPPVKPIDRPITGIDTPSSGGDLDELYLPTGPTSGPAFKKSTTAQTPSPQIVPVETPSDAKIDEDPRIATLPALPDDLPDGLKDDLKELEFFALAGMREEAQNLLFELTTTYPNYAPIIMERMSLLETGD